MEITLTEALRMKTEISSVVKTLTYTLNYASLGDTKEDGEVISQNDNVFSDVEEKLINALNYSEELNDTISSFNRTNRVDSIVRKMQNAKLLLNAYNNALPKTKPSTQKRFENLGTVRKSVNIEYVPLVSSSTMKNSISSQKETIRTLQTDLERLNQGTINVSFTYSDLENLSL